jgi:hypothetical protein
LAAIQNARFREPGVSVLLGARRGVPTGKDLARALAGYVYCEVATVMAIAIEGLDRGLRFSVCRHFDKPESTGTTGFPIRDNLGFGHFAMLAEERLKVLRRGTEREVPHVEIT